GLLVIREYADTMALVMRDAATGVEDAQAVLRTAEDLAAASHVTIGADGSVTAQGPMAGPAEARGSALVQGAPAIAAETDAQITARLRAVGLFSGASTGNPSAASALAAAAGRLAESFDQAMIPAKGSDPAEVNAWWKSLSAAQRNRLISEFPARI